MAKKTREKEDIATIPYAVTYEDVEKAKRNWWAKLSQKERDGYMKAFKIYGSENKPAKEMNYET